VCAWQGAGAPLYSLVQQATATPPGACQGVAVGCELAATDY
jgi:hypothetical protein